VYIVRLSGLRGARGPSGNTSGTISGQDPMLGLLRYNGGYSPTRELLPGSPAIDAADPNICPAIDQRGVFRPYDGDNNGSAICDIGAFEATGPMSFLVLPVIHR
jgi:hypothetical protein